MEISQEQYLGIRTYSYSTVISIIFPIMFSAEALNMESTYESATIKIFLSNATAIYLHKLFLLIYNHTKIGSSTALKNIQRR